MDKGAFLKEIRLKHKLSRDKIGKLLGVSGSVIRDYEINRVIVNSSTKYVQGICALFGYNPKIFDYDEITPELLEKLELSKFAKSIRKYLYFSGYEIEVDKKAFSSKFIDYILFTLLKFKEVDKKIFDLIIPLISRKQNTTSLIIDNIEYSYNDILIFELFIVIAIEKFNPSEFGNINEYFDIINYKNKFMKKWKYKIDEASALYYEKHNHFRDELDYVIDKSSPLALNQIQLKEKLLSMEKNGLELNIDTIKYTYKYIKYKNLETELKQLEKELNITPAEVVPADNKASEICTLLEYAPEPFKDKLLNKLKEYKKDIEEL